MKKKILIVIDMQNDFINGALGTKEAQLIVSKVVAKIKEFQRESVSNEIYVTRDTHFKEDCSKTQLKYENTQEGRKLPVPHCLKDTGGWKLNPDIQEVLGTEIKIYDKYTFGSVALAEDLSQTYQEEIAKDNLEIQLIGLCTDICVISNAMLLKAYMPNVEIIVDAECCAGVTTESHKNALEAMKMCQISVINE